MRSETKFKIVALFLVLIAMALLGELTLRLFFAHHLALREDERSLDYNYDPELGWFPKPNSSTVINASRPITAKHNSDGFRDVEFATSTNPAILFLGDSFVWGYDVNAPERFTDKLQARHPEWKIYNCGVSGYGNDQEYLLLEKEFDHFKPRIVFLMYCTETDYQDNAYNFGYGYYKPYFTTAEDGHVVGHGIPVPRGERLFWAEHRDFPRFYLARLFIKVYYNITGPPTVHLDYRDGRNQNPTAALLLTINKFVRSKGATFIVGITDANPKLVPFLEANSIVYVDVSNPFRYKEFGKHWTPEGHNVVCDKVEQTLKAFLPAAASVQQAKLGSPSH